MDSLENSVQPTPTHHIWNTALIYGAYCGGALVVYSLIMYLLGINLMSLSGIVILYGSIIAIGSVIAVMAIRHQRDQLDGGYISFGKALLLAALTIFIGMFISGLWNYVLLNFIDPSYIATLKDQFMETWGENMPEEALDEALKGFETAGEFTTTLKNSLSGGVFLGLLIGLITAAVMKKQPEISMR